jgi:hypothetical protein
MNSVKHQEQLIAQKRRMGDNAQHFPMQTFPNVTETKTYENDKSLAIRTSSFHEEHRTFTTVTYDDNLNNIFMSSETVINQIAKNEHLQTQQLIVFRIIARSFINTYVEKKKKDHEESLRMFLTGPGGTGKTHVVKAVQKVMKFYGAEHTIRFLAPTGSAASLVDGMTIHKGLGIKVQSTNKGKGNRNLGEHQEDYSVVISVQNKIK